MGISFYLWGGIALAVAVLNYFFWPKPLAGREREPWAHFILRWFHPLVWLLLAAAGLLFGLGKNGPGNLLALMALGLYAVFMVTLIWDRRKKTS